MFNIQQKDVAKNIGLRVNGNQQSVHVSNEGYEALGISGDKCVIYSNPTNQIIELSHAEIVNPSKLAISIGARYIRLKLNITEEEYFKRSPAFGLTIIEECQSKGIINYIQTRGRGFWITEDGNILINSTKLTDINGNEYSRRQGAYVYKSSGDVGYYSDTVEADITACRAIYDMLYSFNFKKKSSSSYKMMGFLACGFLPGVLPWRPSVLAKGGTGTGKSTLSKSFHSLFGDSLCFRYTASSSTTAGLIQKLGDDAQVALLDELEASDSTSRLLQYNRNASEGVNGVKGSSSGRNVSYNGKTCFLFGGINPPKMEDADANRLLFVELEQSKRTNEKHFLLYDEFNKGTIKTLNRLGKGVCMRVLRKVQELIDTSYKIKDTMYSLGYSDRLCDTYAPAIAGAWVLLNDEVIEDKDILNMISLFEIEKETDQTSLALNMYHNIFNSLIKVDTKTTTLNFLIRDYVNSVIDMEPQIRNQTESILSLYGIRLEFTQNIKDISKSDLSMYIKHKNNDNLIRVVSSDHKNLDLDNLFMQLKGAIKHDKTVRIGGLATRVIKVPLNFVDFYDNEVDTLKTEKDKILDTTTKIIKETFSMVGKDLNFN